MTKLEIDRMCLTFDNDFNHGPIVCHKAAVMIRKLYKELKDSQELMKRCAKIVDVNLYHQHEKVEDVSKLIKDFLSKHEEKLS